MFRPVDLYSRDCHMSIVDQPCVVLSSFNEFCSSVEYPVEVKAEVSGDIA